LPKTRRRRSRLIRARHRPVQPSAQDAPNQERGQGDRYGTYQGGFHFRLLRLECNDDLIVSDSG
jgi:hypothetical protein